jgi:putative membrane protein
MPFPASRLARFELRRFRGPLPKLALVFVLMIPLLYGAIYLTANWDPYGKLENLPVALVNQDRPTTVGGKRIDAGADFARDLHTKHIFDWVDVDEAEADRGLREGDYYLAVVVPPDFSADLVSGRTDQPERARIMLRRNDANGFVVGSITNSAQNSIARAVDESAEQSYFNAVFANLATIRAGLLDASQGSQRLTDGLGSARSGAGKLATGAKDAQAGAQQLSAGATDLSRGLGTAKTGATSLASGLDDLERGSSSLSTGAAQVAAGTQQLQDKVLPPLNAVQRVLPDVADTAGDVSSTLDTISTTATARSHSVDADLDSAATALTQLEQDHPELADDPAFGRLQDRVASASGHADDIAEQVATGSKRVDRITRAVQSGGDLDSRVAAAKKNVTDLNSGAQQVATGAKKLDRGIGSAADGADRLTTGIGSAAAGADRLATGAGSLSTGVGTLRTGAGDLDAGLGTLFTGAETLHDGLAKGAARIPTLTQDEQDEAVQVLSSPADVTQQIDNPAHTYGRGLAPLFFSIALWVFGISVFLVVRPITGRALAGRAGAARLAVTGWLPIGGIAAVAGWLMVGAVWLYPGLDPLHPLLTMALVTLGAICFSAIAHLLRTALGTPGSSLLLVGLILQLTAGGGTYPGPLLPQFFRSISPFLPMTYLIDAFRVAISGGLMSHLVRDVVILALIAAGALGLCILVVRRRQQFSMKDLHPPLVAP